MMMMVVVETMMVMMVVVVETMMVMVVGATIWKVGGESRQKRVSSCLRSSSPSFAHYCHTTTLPHYYHTATLQLALLLLLNALHSNYQPPSWQNQPAAAAEILMLIIIIIAIAIIVIVIVITNVK